MTIQDLKIILQDDIRDIIRQNIESDPTRVALNAKEHGAVIATQVKYLQRARTKLPSYYRELCIIPPLAFEQCSSEQTAAVKKQSGKLCIDLTCGLGVDSLYFAKEFEKVIAIEQDPLLAQITKHNFALLGATNIEIVNSSAEDFLADPDLEKRVGSELPVDMIYVDPARRGSKGNKLFLLEDCSPNALELLPKLLQISKRLLIKTSPLFDVDQAIRLFTHPEYSTTIEVVSSDGECKELLIEMTHKQTAARTTKTQEAVETKIKVTIAGRGSLEFGTEAATVPQTFSPPYTHLLIPDVTLYKARLNTQYLNNQSAYATSQTGYGLTSTPIENFWGQQIEIEQIIPYQPRKLKAVLKQKEIKRAIILKKDFAHDADTIAKTLNIKLGGSTKIAFTRINNSPYAIILKNE